MATTPFDVMKTRTMTAAPGMPSTMGTIMVAIVKEEGLLALFKGAIPRVFLDCTSRRYEFCRIRASEASNGEQGEGSLKGGGLFNCGSTTRTV